MHDPAASDLEDSRTINNTQKIEQAPKVQTPHKTNGNGSYNQPQYSSKSPHVFAKPKSIVDNDAGDFGMGSRTKSKPIAIEPRISLSSSRSYRKSMNLSNHSVSLCNSFLNCSLSVITTRQNNEFYQQNGRVQEEQNKA